MLDLNQMIRPDLEEDYEANYPDGFRPDPYIECSIPVGQCKTMCSTAEMMERERHQRLSKYEMKPNIAEPQADPGLAIKEFKRSSVGREFSSIYELRPWSILRKALHHLLLKICFEDDDWMFICDFVFDRLKAIRQDAVIQRIEGLRYIEILEGSIRFLVYSMYRLTCTLQDYASIQPCESLIPLDGPVTGLDNYELNIIREMKLTMKSLRDCLSSLIIQYQENVPESPHRSLFEAVNLIVNLPFLPGHSQCSTDFQARSNLRNSDPIFKLVFKMYREHLAGNHCSAIKHVPQLIEHPLLILAYAPTIAQLQVHLIQLLRKAYSATGANTSSVLHLCSIICPDWLDYDVDERIFFGQFVAVQFGFYDEERNLCDYKLGSTRRLPRDFVEKAKMDYRKLLGKEPEENETRAYALQMVLGREWSFYQEVIKLHGLEYILDPSRQA